MKLKLAAVVVSSVLSAQAFADTYFGTNYSIVDSEISNPTALSVKIGKFMGENIAVEARLGFGLQDDKVEGLSGVESSIDNMYGVYGIYNFAPKSDFNPYAILGYTNVKATVNSPVGSASDSEKDISYGLGASFKLSETASFNVEWARVIDKSDAELETISFGVSWEI